MSTRRRNTDLERAAQQMVTTARLAVLVLKADAAKSEGAPGASLVVLNELSASVDALDAALSPEPEPPKRGRPLGSRNRVQVEDGVKDGEQ